jgi:hypothetical protein
MPYRSSFFTAQETSLGVYDRVYSANDFINYFDKMFSNGVIVVGGGVLSTELQVSKVTDTMKVSINLGSAFINGHQFEIYTAPIELTHDTADATYSRIDRIVLELNLTDEVRAIVPKIVKGTPASSPSVPSLTQTDTIYQISLAKITIPANVSSLNTAFLADERTVSNVKIGISGNSAEGITVDDTDFTEITGENVQDVLDSIDDVLGTLENNISTAQTTANDAIPKSIIDASGDLIYGSANDTVARLAKGANGQILQLASGLPSWANPSLFLISDTSIASLTASATINIPTGSSNRPSQIFVWYDLKFTKASSSGSVDVRLRLNSDTGGNYEGCLISFNNGTITSAASGAGYVSLGAHYAVYNNDSITNIGSVQISQPNNLYQNSIQADRYSRYAGYGYKLQASYLNSGNEISSVTIYPASDNIRSGRILVWGVKNG